MSASATPRTLMKNYLSADIPPPRTSIGFQSTQSSESENSRNTPLEFTKKVRFDGSDDINLNSESVVSTSYKKSVAELQKSLMERKNETISLDSVFKSTLTEYALIILSKLLTITIVFLLLIIFVIMIEPIQQKYFSKKVIIS